jgi:hypothetical protein
VLLGIDIALERLQSTGAADVCEVLMDMRADRGCMIQTHEQ